MPYKNVHYIKLMLELFDDRRFIKELNDSQKLDYILWLAMAGLTQNDTEKDFEWLKTRFNLTKKVDEITLNFEKILRIFKKIYLNKRKGKEYVKFKNFKKLHNPLRNADGTPKDSQRIDKNILEYIILEYIRIKHWENQIKNQPSLMTEIYQRNSRAAKRLWLALDKNEKEACRAIRVLGEWFNQRNLEWTLETVLKHLPRAISDSNPEGQKRVSELVRGIGK